MSGVLAGRAAIVTGGSKGLGFAISRAFAAAGARVLLCSRDHATLEAAGATLADEGYDVAVQAGDVSAPADVDRIVKAALERFGELHVLVNNAGVYGPKGPVEDVDWNAWLRTIEINLQGSVLMCRAVLPHFLAAGYGKIIQLSGGGATAPLPRFSAYAASKAAVVRFAETLALETHDTGVDVNALAPGALNTAMLDEVLEAGPALVGEEAYARAQRQKHDGGAPLEAASELAVFLASSASDGITGRLISAVWDPWRSLTAHREELAPSDVYTLRRVVPADRGLTWGALEA